MKVRRLLSLLAVLLCLTMPLSAHADSGIWLDAPNNAVTIHAEGLYEESEYAVILLRDDADIAEMFRGNALVYINQFQASGDGTLELGFVNADFAHCSVYLGGFFPDADSPLYLGKVPAQEDMMRLPAALTTIGEEAFAGSALTVVVVGENTTGIGDRAFMDCVELTQIIIPDSVTDFGTDVFKNCGKLTIVCGQNSAASEYAAANGIPVAFR